MAHRRHGASCIDRLFDTHFRGSTADGEIPSLPLTIDDHATNAMTGAILYDPPKVGIRTRQW